MELWLARDEDGNLHLHSIKPIKNTMMGMWESLELCPLLIYSDRFSEIKWSDKEPTRVKLIIDK